MKIVAALLLGCVACMAFPTNPETAPMLLRRPSPFGGLLSGLLGGVNFGDLAKIGQQGGEWTMRTTPKVITITGRFEDGADPHRVRVQPEGKTLTIQAKEKSVSKKQTDEEEMVGSESNKGAERVFELPFEVKKEDIKRTYDEHSVTLEIPVPEGVEVEEGESSPLMSSTSYSFSSTDGSGPGLFGGNNGFDEMSSFMSARTGQPQGMDVQMHSGGMPMQNPLMNLLGGAFGGGGMFGMPLGFAPRQLLVAPAYAHDAGKAALDRTGDRLATVNSLEEETGAPTQLPQGQHLPEAGPFGQPMMPMFHPMGLPPFMGMLGGPRFGGEMLGGGGLADIESLLGGLDGIGAGELGEWTEETTPKAVTITGKLTDVVKADQLKIKVKGRHLIVKEGHNQDSDATHSHHRESRIFSLPFEANDAAVQKIIDPDTNTVTLTLRVPDGVEVESSGGPMEAGSVISSFSEHHHAHHATAGEGEKAVPIAMPATDKDSSKDSSTPKEPTPNEPMAQPSSP